MKLTLKRIALKPAYTISHLYIDGQKVETEKVFDTFLSVKIPEGTHTVELSFVPPGLIVGGIISLLAPILIPLVIIMLIIRLIGGSGRRW